MESRQRRILKRKRYAPNRKWSEQEQRSLINYIIENKPFESPTGELYYKQFLREQNLNIEWRLVRYKVRNLKVSFMRARDWLSKNADGVLKDAKNPKELLHSIYPLYDDLKRLYEDEILTLQKEAAEAAINSYGDGSICEQDDMKITVSNNSSEHLPMNSNYFLIDRTDPLQTHDISEEDVKPVLNLHTNHNCTNGHSQESNPSFSYFSEASTPFQVNEAASATASKRLTNQQCAGTSNSSNAVKANQTDLSLDELKKRQLQFELQKMREELELKKLEFDLKKEQWSFEKERQQQELQLREAEFKSREKLKMLEIKLEKWKYREEVRFKERMAQREMEMKERMATLDIEFTKN